MGKNGCPRIPNCTLLADDKLNAVTNYYFGLKKGRKYCVVFGEKGYRMFNRILVNRDPGWIKNGVTRSNL